MKTSSSRFWLAGLSFVLALAGGKVLAQSNLSIHGYLTQAYAFTDGHQLFGIPKEGTTDYRTLALQIRYAFDAKSDIIMQFSHKRLGLSPVMEFSDDLELDWAFARHQFCDAASIKFGKVQLPMGVYNELRDVGTLLPFYRAPFAIYRDGSWTSETIDGVVVATTVKKNSPWNLDVQAYYGGWNTLETLYTDFSPFAIARNENGLGAQLWLNTPVDELRFGLEGHRQTVFGGVRRSGDRDDWTSWMASIDAHIRSLIAQAEYQHISFPQGSGRAGYVHLGLALSDAFSVHSEMDWARLRIHFVASPIILRGERTLMTDHAIGLRWAFTPHMVFKAETHWNDGILIEDEARDFFGDPAAATRYVIFSLSASF